MKNLMLLILLVFIFSDCLSPTHIGVWEIYPEDKLNELDHDYLYFREDGKMRFYYQSFPEDGIVQNNQEVTYQLNPSLGNLILVEWPTSNPLPWAKANITQETLTLKMLRQENRIIRYKKIE